MTHKSVEEFKVTTIEVAGIGPAFKALRLPFGKESRSNSTSDAYVMPMGFIELDDDKEDVLGCFFWTRVEGCIEDKDIKLI